MMVRILKDAIGPKGVHEYCAFIQVRGKEILLTEDELQQLAGHYVAIQDEKRKCK